MSDEAVNEAAEIQLTRSSTRVGRDLGKRAASSSNPKIGGLLVSVLIRFTPASLTAAQYDDVVRRLNEAGVFPAEGLDYEIC